MSNLKNATLVLRTADLPLNGSNARGTMNDTRTQMTWNNINLRLLLGDMYDSCDLFNLSIVQLASTSPGALAQGVAAPTVEVQGAERTIILEISGLPFINQTYNFRNGCNTNVTQLCCFLVPSIINTPFVATFTNNFLTFGKNQDMCNITISYTRTNVSLISAMIATDIILLFNIYGVTKEPSYNSNKRIF